MAQNLVSAKIDVATGSKAELLVEEVDIVGSALGGHLDAALTIATLYYRHHNKNEQFVTVTRRARIY